APCLLDLLARERLEMRRVAMDQPLEALFDIHDVGDRDHEPAAGSQDTREFGDGVGRILDVLEAFDTDDDVERRVVLWQPRVEVPRSYLNAVKLEDLGIEIAARDIIPKPLQPLCKRSLSRRNIQQ